jgi:hypothetical protein
MGDLVAAGPAGGTIERCVFEPFEARPSRNAGGKF